MEAIGSGHPVWRTGAYRGDWRGLMDQRGADELAQP